MEGYLDIVALVLSFLVAVVLTTRNRKINSALRPVSLYFFLLGPVLIMVHMAFHLGENLYRAARDYGNGAFYYGFHFYSLLLLGFVLLACGYHMYRKLVLYTEARSTSKDIWRVVLLIAVISLPLIPITLFSFLPLGSCVFSLAAMPSVFKKSSSLAS